MIPRELIIIIIIIIIMVIIIYMTLSLHQIGVVM